MELTPDPPPEPGPQPLVAFSPPRPAFDDGRYAISPYLHYHEERRRRGVSDDPDSPHPVTAGETASRFELLLERLIEDTLR